MCCIEMMCFRCFDMFDVLHTDDMFHILHRDDMFQVLYRDDMFHVLYRDDMLYSDIESTVRYSEHIPSECDHIPSVHFLHSMELIYICWT